MRAGGKTESRITVKVAASMDEAKREARKLVESGIAASVVKVEKLVGYSGVPKWMSVEEVAEQIRRHLCKAQNIPYDPAKFQIVERVYETKDGTKH
jgi:hypothetical protein